MYRSQRKQLCFELIILVVIFSQLFREIVIKWKLIMYNYTRGCNYRDISNRELNALIYLALTMKTYKLLFV